MAQDLLFLRDLAEVEPPRDRYKLYDDEDIYRHVPRPQWTGLDDEIWTPRNQESDPQLEKVKALIKKQSDDEITAAEATLTGEEDPDNRGRHTLASLPSLPKRLSHSTSQVGCPVGTVHGILMK